MSLKIPFSFQERKEIEKYIEKGFSGSKIARLINRSNNGVNTEIRRGGGKSYSAVFAQKRADDVKDDKNKNFIYNPDEHPIARMKQRIENMEMQIEILHETILEMKKNDKLKN